MQTNDYSQLILQALYDNGIIDEKLYGKCRLNYIINKSINTHNKCKSVPKNVQSLIDLFNEDESAFEKEFATGRECVDIWKGMIDEKHNTDFTDDEEGALSYWKSESYWFIQDYFYNKKEFEEDVKSGRVSESRIKEIVKNLDSAIDKTSGIPKNMVNSRGGHWEEKWVEGYIGTFMGYSATTNGHGQGGDWTDWEEGIENQTRYSIDFYSLSGTKAIAFSSEDEILYGRRLNFYVLSVDGENKNAKILVW